MEQRVRVRGSRCYKEQGSVDCGINPFELELGEFSKLFINNIRRLRFPDDYLLTGHINYIHTCNR